MVSDRQLAAGRVWMLQLYFPEQIAPPRVWREYFIQVRKKLIRSGSDTKRSLLRFKV